MVKKEIFHGLDDDMIHAWMHALTAIHYPTKDIFESDSFGKKYEE